MVDDARFAITTPERAWGGPRQANWRELGKRAVILLPAEVYELVTEVNYLTQRPVRDLHLQTYYAGMEALFQQPMSVLLGDYTYDPTRRLRWKDPKPTTHDQLREFISSTFVFEDSDDD